VRPSSALMGLDCSIIVSAFSRPTSRGSRCVPPNPGITPTARAVQMLLATSCNTSQDDKMTASIW